MLTIIFKFSMHSSQESLWMLFLFINERRILAFLKKLFCIKSRTFSSHKVFNTIINNFWYDCMTRIWSFEIFYHYEYFFQTSADWYIIMRLMNVANTILIESLLQFDSMLTYNHAHFMRKFIALFCVWIVLHKYKSGPKK